MGMERHTSEKCGKDTLSRPSKVQLQTKTLVHGGRVPWMTKSRCYASNSPYSVPSQRGEHAGMRGSIVTGTWQGTTHAQRPGLSNVDTLSAPTFVPESTMNTTE